jgi:hypothetical protein
MMHAMHMMFAPCTHTPCKHACKQVASYLWDMGRAFTVAADATWVPEGVEPGPSRGVLCARAAATS